MSSSIDNPIVKMTFDNASFQKNVEGTMSSLDKLKQKLEFKDGTKGLDDIATGFNRINLGPLSFQLDGISTKFLALAAVAGTVFAGITAKAASAGANMVKSLSIQPVIDGYKEYETNIGSIQTILANTQSKGSTLEDVNGALDQLNEYSDKTIYNFSEMTKNIGTFTAAGVDLDTSVSSIKGIANLAAMSGSNSAQASTAMYQLSQAIAAGSVKLMDWNSVVNAGMGGEAFKSALFETGKAMKTLTNVPMDMSFTEWEAAGNSFRDSLQDGWITAEVLTTTLGGLSGELDYAALSAKGFSDEQIVAIQKTADTATKAATEVKTASQLFQTIKESIGSGWAQSFRTVVGDFVEAKQLFSGLYNFFNGFIQRSSTARNDLLNGWKFLGGRDTLVQGLVYSLAAVTSALKPIKDAFRAVFPPATGFTLLELTTRFRDFAQKLIISGETANKVKAIFTGFFSIIKIGVEIGKGIFSVISNLASILFGLVGSLGGAGASAGNFVSRIREILVEGGGIQKFFGFINSGVTKFGEVLNSAKDKIAGLFGKGDGIPGAGQATGVVDKVRNAFEKLSEVWDKIKAGFKKVGDGFSSLFSGIKDALSAGGNAVSDFFSSLIDKISNAFTGDAFEPILKTFGVGFLGGITFILGRFLKNGLSLDFGQGKLFDSIIGTFDQLTSTIKTFQTSVRADNLLKIAAAMAILAASIIALALLDPAKIATSLGALAVGMGQIVGVLALLSKIESSPVTLLGLALAMGAVGLASIGFAIAVRLLSGLNLKELATGLAGIAGIIGVMTIAVKHFDGSSFVKAGISLIVLSGALWLFSKVVGSFSNMPFGDMAKGLIAVGIALGMFAVLTNVVDSSDMVKIGIGFVGFALGLKTIYKVIEQFGGLDWDTLARGFIGLGGGLAIIIIAMKNLPKGKELAEKALGMLALSAALYIMSQAVKTLGELDLGTLAKGVGGLSILLLGLVVATKALENAAVGVAAIIVVAGALFVFSEVIKRLGELSIGQIVTALGAIAGILIVLGLAAAALVAFPPLLGALVGLGIALIAIGAGFALFGAGAYLAAKGLEALGKVGKKSVERLIDVLNEVAKAIPGFAQKFAEGLISFAQALADGANDLMDAVGELLGKLLDKVIELTPKIAEAIGGITVKAIEWMRQHIPEFITLGFELLTAFLQGINNNIELLSNLAVQIISNFINGIASGIPLLVESAVNLIVNFINAIAANIQRIIDAGVNLLVQFLNGIASAIGDVTTAVGNIISAFINAVFNLWGTIAKSGTDALVVFLGGISDNLSLVTQKAGELVRRLIDDLTNEALKLIETGKNAILKFLDGLADNSVDFADKAMKIIIRFTNELSDAIDNNADDLRRAGKKLAGSIASGITGGLSEKVGDVAGAAGDLARKAIDAAKGLFRSNSPSKVFIGIGKDAGDGLAIGLKKTSAAENASANLANATVLSFNKALGNLYGSLASMDELNPTITPVLDLSVVQKDAKSLNGILGASPMTASLSYGRASYISGLQSKTQTTTLAQTSTQPTEIKFEQVINAPSALSTNDIYRNTRSQIAMAKEKLRILS